LLDLDCLSNKNIYIFPVFFYSLILYDYLDVPAFILTNINKPKKEKENKQKLKKQ